MKTSTLSIPEQVATVQPDTPPTFEALYEAYYPLIRRYVARTVYQSVPYDTAIVDDLVQDTFIKVWRAYPGDLHHQDYRAWIFTIAHHTCIDWLRKRHCAHHYQEALTEWHVGHLVARDDLLRIEQRECLATAWLTLRARDTCVLYHLACGYRNREIASKLQVQPATVKTWVMRARRALRRAVQLQEAS